MLYRPGQTSGGLRTEQQHTDQIVTAIGPLPFPLDAKLNQTGEQVTLLQTCNWQGNSPAVIGIVGGKFILSTLDEVSEIRRAVV